MICCEKILTDIRPTYVHTFVNSGEAIGPPVATAVGILDTSSSSCVEVIFRLVVLTRAGINIVSTDIWNFSNDLSSYFLLAMGHGFTVDSSL